MIASKPKSLTFDIPAWRRADRCETCKAQNVRLFFIDEPIERLLYDLFDAGVVEFLSEYRYWVLCEACVSTAILKRYPISEASQGYNLIMNLYLDEAAREILRESLKAMEYSEENSYEALKKSLMDHCEERIDAQLKHAKAGQGIALTVFVEIVNPDFSFESESPRNSQAAQDWRKAVMERDGYACRDCGKQGAIQAHHIEEWAQAPTKRYDLDNGLNSLY